jgi:hypothetical protein
LRDFLVSEKYNENTGRFLILKGSSPYFDLNFEHILENLKIERDSGN